MAGDLLRRRARRRVAHLGRHREHLPRRPGRPRPRPASGGSPSPSCSPPTPPTRRSPRRPSTSTSSTASSRSADDLRLARRPGGRGHRRAHRASSWPRRPATRTASSTTSPRSPRRPPSGACSATSTPASAAGCCRGGSGWASPSRRGTSGSPGVTSLSADVHKYGYAFKGASIVALRAPGTCYRHQFFLYDDWPGGLYGSSTSAGTRGGVPIAEAWAADPPPRRRGLPAPAARSCGTPPAASRRASTPSTASRSPASPTCRCSSSARRRLDIGGVGDVMDDRGWHLDRQQGGLHVMVSPGHAQVVDRSSPTWPTPSPPTSASRGRRPPTAGRSDLTALRGRRPHRRRQPAHGHRQGAARGRRRALARTGGRRAPGRRGRGSSPWAVTGRAWKPSAWTSSPTSTRARVRSAGS